MAKKGNNPYKYFGKKLAHTLLTRMGVSGFLFGPLGVVFGFVFELGLKYKVYKADQTVIKVWNKKDQADYFKLIDTTKLKTEEQKEKYRKSFLKRLSEILSLKKFIKK